MTIEACRTVKFGDPRAPSHMQNGGVIVLETGRVFGGDSFFAYLGTYSTAGDTVSGTLTVIRHDPMGQSMYGQDEDIFELGFTATRVDDNHFRGGLARAGFPNAVLSLDRLAELP